MRLEAWIKAKRGQSKPKPPLAAVFGAENRSRRAEDLLIKAKVKPTRLATVPGRCVLLDDIGYIEDVSPDGARFLQRSRDSLLRTPFASIVSEEYSRSWLTHFLAHRTPGRQGKTRLVLNIGRSKRTVEVSTETSSSLDTVRFIVTFHEGSRTQEGKKSSLEMLSNLVGHIYDLVITVDRNGNVVFTNQPILERLPEQVIGTSFYDYVRPYDLKRFRMAIDRAFASGTNTDFINEGLVCFPPHRRFRVRIKPLPIKSRGRKSSRTLETEMAMILFADITDQQRAEQQLSRMDQNRQRVARRANLIREEERKRLALELHDQVGQSLTALKIDLSLAKRKLTERDRASRLAIESAESTVDQILNVVRELSAQLRPPLLDDLGLVAALQFQMETFQKRTGIRGTFKTTTEEVSASAEIALGIFRVFQEIMTNVIRHSRASQVDVDLEVHRGWLFLTVADNGRGITEDELYSPKSLGLMGMHERAEELGGAIHIQRGSAAGTTVVMQVPLTTQRRRRDRAGAVKSR
jgi:signal transduction histidine kinase